MPKSDSRRLAIRRDHFLECLVTVGPLHQPDSAVVRHRTDYDEVIQAIDRGERVLLEECGVPDYESLKPPRGISLRGARRSLRVRAGDIVHQAHGDAMKLEFTLPSGSYATVLL